MDLILRNARVRGHDRNVDIGVDNGVIAKIAPEDYYASAAGY